MAPDLYHSDLLQGLLCSLSACLISALNVRLLNMLTPMMFAIDLLVLSRVPKRVNCLLLITHKMVERICLILRTYRFNYIGVLKVRPKNRWMVCVKRRERERRKEWIPPWWLTCKKKHISPIPDNPRAGQANYE